MNNSINHQGVQNSTAHKCLLKRLEQDAARDPLDALTDAESLLTILQCIHNVLFNPTTRYLLSFRIAEDLARDDLSTALLEAQELVAIQRNRWEVMKEVASDR